MKKITKQILLPEEKIEIKRAKQNREIEQELRKIYMKDGKLPNFQKFDHEKKSKKKLFLIGMIAFFAVLAVSAWAGFFILKPYERFGGKGVRFEIEGPKKIISGKASDITLSYFNNEGVPLAEASVNLLLTPGYIIKESSPEQTEPGVWNLGSLEKGEKGKINVKIIFIGEEDDKATLTGSMNYRPANFNSEFEKIASYTGTINEIILGIEAEGAIEAEPGEEIEYKIIYKNLSDEEIFNVAVNPVLPEQFIFATSTPAPNKGKIWYFEKLAPEAEGEIILKGSYSSEISGEINQKFEVGFVIDENTFVAQEDVEIPLTILKSDLILTLLVNGGRGGSANFGDTLNYLISFKNDGEEKLEDVELKVIFEPSPIINGRSPLNWGSLEEDYGATKKEFELLWDGHDMSKLNELNIGEEGTMDFSLNLINYALSDKEDHVVSAWIEAVIGKKGEKESGRVVQSTRVDLTINSNLEFNAYGRYFNDDNIAVGSGPLPPRVGNTTSYKVFWKIENSLHNLDNVVVSAKLPTGVSWDEKDFSEYGDIFYDKESRKVFWRIDKLPKTITETEASFNISVTPESSDVGNTLKILENSTIEARDIETNGLIIITEPSLTTELLGDPEAEGRGRVIEL